MMFESFFNFTKTPFVRDMPPDSLYITPALKSLNSRLAHGIKNRSFLIVTGDAGCGKTTATCSECVTHSVHMQLTPINNVILSLVLTPPVPSFSTFLSLTSPLVIFTSTYSANSVSNLGSFAAMPNANSSKKSFSSVPTINNLSSLSTRLICVTWKCLLKSVSFSISTWIRTLLCRSFSSANPRFVIYSKSRPMKLFLNASTFVAIFLLLIKLRRWTISNLILPLLPALLLIFSPTPLFPLSLTSPMVCPCIISA